jgi:hypothetical protein
MSKRANSHLPSDLLTGISGSNYGLDGFGDNDYDKGVEEHVTLSQYGEFPAFPTGLTKGAAAGLMDLTELTREAATLSNLSWLEDAFQDVERLPKNPVDRGIPELEEAWGLNHPTNGVLVPARDLKQARYEEQTSPKKKAHDPRRIKEIVATAMRRSAAGHRLEDILRDSYSPLGNDGHLIKAAMDVVSAEHGLVGNVFIRASAYPGYGQGKWSDHVRKVAKDALYIVADPEVIKSASWIVDGRCTMTGKKVVASVPWAEAYSHYAPRLRLAGHRVASTEAHKTALRQAFLTAPERVVKATELPVHVTPSERVTTAEAKSAIAGAKVDRKVLTPAKTADTRLRDHVLQRVAALRKSNVLDEASYQRVITSSLSPKEMMHEVVRMVRATQRDYAGPVIEQHVALRAAKQAADLTMAKFGSTLRWVRQAMSEGFAGRDLTSLIERRFANDVLAEARPVIDQTRKAHEGASGFIYVDAAAYASERGVKGCEDGALKHRANTLRTVLAMDRCGTCAHARTLEDGTAKCGVYGKVLASAEDFGTDLDRIKTANIKTVNSTDAEVTASMFASKFDPTEFSLHNAAMTGFDLAPLPEHEKMGEIALGGMLWSPE